MKALSDSPRYLVAENDVKMKEGKEKVRKVFFPLLLTREQL